MWQLSFIISSQGFFLSQAEQADVGTSRQRSDVIEPGLPNPKRQKVNAYFISAVLFKLELLFFHTMNVLFVN